MHLLEKPIDYSKTEEFTTDVNKLSLEDAKKLVKKLYEDNRNYKQVAARAAVTVEQYKHLLSVFDGYSEDKENMSEVGNYFRRMLVGTFDASRNLAFWVKMLSEAAKQIVFEDPVIQDLFSIVGNVCREIYTSSSEFKSHKKLLSDEPNGICVRNLERTEEENSENPARGFYSHQSALINRREENTNVLQKGGKNSHSEHDKSTLEDRSSLQEDDATGGEEAGNSSLKQSASTCENEFIEGGENRSRNEVACEKRKEKTFGISYLKSQNLFQHDVIQNEEISANISVKCNESEPSTSFDQLTSENRIDEDNQSLSENDMTEDVETVSGFSSSKNESKSKRKFSLSTEEGNVTKRGRKKRKVNTYQNSDTVTKKSRRSRKSSGLNTLENDDDVKSIGESETIKLQNSFSSKRHQRSNKHETLNIHETELSENSSPQKGKRLKKHDLFLASETEDVISSVKPKRNRRGRRKKLNVTQEKETDSDFKYSTKSNSVSHENVPYAYASGSKNVIKYSCVVLTDVLDDPEAQHYIDVIQYKERKENEYGCGVRWKERTEVEETASNKERSEMEALQEWNVLDAVSDEEDKELDNMEGAEELSNNNDNRQTSDSEVEQEETANDNDGEQLEIDDSDRELDDCSDVEHDESSPSKHDVNRNRSSSDNEIKELKKGPSTPDVSPHESELEDNSDAQDENDADSVRSYEDEDISSRSPTSGSPIYGKKGPRTPPSPAPFEPLRRGPQTPPGNGPDSEVMDDEENDIEYSSD